MTIPIAEQGRRADSRPGRRQDRPSLREVCLLGGERAGTRREPGDRVRCSGRTYRVASTHESSAGDSRPYVHLSALPEPVG